MAIIETENQATVFLNTLFGGIDKGFLTIWTDNKQTHWFPVNEREKASSTALELSNTLNVYFGIGPRKERLSDDKRGKSKDVSCLPCVWLEIDIKGGKHSKENLPSQQETEMILNSFDLEPSIIVHSGGGLHCYWLFDKAFRVLTETERASANRMLERFQSMFIRLAKTKNLHIDNTSDLARVLRVPGTYNRKEQPKPVKLLKMSDSRYTILELKKAIENLESKLPSNYQEIRRKNEMIHKELPDAKFEPIKNECSFMKSYIDNKETSSYAEWMAALSIGAFCEDYENVGHGLSLGHPSYSEFETEQKIREIRKNMKPRTCASLNEFGKCNGCKHFNKINSPITIGMRNSDNFQILIDKDNNEFRSELPLKPWEKKIIKNKGKNNEKEIIVYSHNLMAEHLMEKFHTVRYPDADSNVYFYDCDQGVYQEDKKFNRISSIIRGFVPDIKLSEIKETTEYIKTQSDIKIKTHSGYIAVGNGLIDYSGVLHPFTPNVFLLDKLSTNYNPNAFDSYVDSTIKKVACNHKPTISNIEEMFGCVLFPETIVPKIFHLYGKTAHNGKSAILSLINNTFGENGKNISAETPQRLADNQFASSSLVGKMANVIDDLPDTIIEDIGYLKTIVTGGNLQVESKGKDARNVLIEGCPVIIASNYFLNIKENGKQVDRRLHIIPCEHDFSTDPECLSDIDSKRLANTNSAKEYVLKLAINAMVRMLESTSQERLTPNDRAAAELSIFKDSNDKLSDFWEEITLSDVLEAKQTDVYKTYTEWAKESGNKYPYGKERFQNALCAHFNVFPKKKDIKINGIFKTIRGYELNLSVVSDKNVG